MKAPGAAASSGEVERPQSPLKRAIKSAANMKSDKFDPTKDLSTGGSMPMQYPPMMGQMQPYYM